jgi:hypothetical protein
MADKQIIQKYCDLCGKKWDKEVEAGPFNPTVVYFGDEHCPECRDKKIHEYEHCVMYLSQTDICDFKIYKPGLFVQHPNTSFEFYVPYSFLAHGLEEVEKFVNALSDALAYAKNLQTIYNQAEHLEDDGPQGEFHEEGDKE